MKLKILLALLLMSALAACGTKSDLTAPGGKSQPYGQKDPAKPPSPLGQ